MKAMVWTLIFILALGMGAHFALEFEKFNDRASERAHEMFMEFARQGKLIPVPQQPQPKMENL